jgi:hypothetical protein
VSRRRDPAELEDIAAGLLAFVLFVLSLYL